MIMYEKRLLGHSSILGIFYPQEGGWFSCFVGILKWFQEHSPSPAMTKDCDLVSVDMGALLQPKRL